MKIVSFLLFPTDISEDTVVAIESDGGDFLLLSIAKGDDLIIKLDTEEIFKLKEILLGLNRAAPPKVSNVGGDNGARDGQDS